MPFAGFKKDQVRFFRQLAARQDREWFKENKTQYLALCEEPMKDLIDGLQAILARQYRGHALAPPKHFRIYLPAMISSLGGWEYARTFKNSRGLAARAKRVAGRLEWTKAAPHPAPGA